MYEEIASFAMILRPGLVYLQSQEAPSQNLILIDLFLLEAETAVFPPLHSHVTYKFTLHLPSFPEIKGVISQN